MPRYPDHWAESFSGVIIDYGDAYYPHSINTPILIVDIAHALSNICRFNGHSSAFYSVAEHSINVAALVMRERPLDHVTALGALLHDAHEAYLGDVITPLKRVLGSAYADLEARYNLLIGKEFGVDLSVLDDVVRQADLAMLEAERRYLCSPSVHDWGIDFGSLPGQMRRHAADLLMTSPLAPDQAKHRFMLKFGEIAARVRKS